MKTFREIVIRIGPVRGVLAATTLATMSSVIFTYVVMAIDGKPISNIALTISTLAPLTIAPFLFWPLFSAFTTIHNLEQEMRRLAMVDELTGIMNRRAFLTNADYVISLANRNQMEMAMVYLDLDNFKSINDRYGHATGDTVLKRFADVVSAIVRKSDLFGRLGGEEFALVISGTSKEAAQHFVERLLGEVRSIELDIAGAKIRFTASAGLAYFGPGEHKALEHLLARSDKALHRAKHEGKDRLVCSAEFGELSAA